MKKKSKTVLPVSQPQPQPISMNCVYASPERMDSGYAPRRNNVGTYPLVYAQEIMRAKFCRVCGSPLRILNNSCEACGSNILPEMDPEGTMRFCRTCGSSFPKLSSYCPFCGRKVG